MTIFRKVLSIALGLLTLGWTLNAIYFLATLHGAYIGNAFLAGVAGVLTFYVWPRARVA